MNEPILRLFPILVLCCVFLARRIADSQLHRLRRAREARALTAMMIVELQSLLGHYHDNLAVLAAGGTTPLSLRAAGPVFRGSANRLAGSMRTETLTALVAVYAHHERVESLMALCTRAASPRFAPTAIQADLDRLDERLVIGCRLIAAAAEALGHPYTQADDLYAADEEPPAPDAAPEADEGLFAPTAENLGKTRPPAQFRP